MAASKVDTGHNILLFLYKIYLNWNKLFLIQYNYCPFSIIIAQLNISQIITQGTYVWIVAVLERFSQVPCTKKRLHLNNVRITLVAEYYYTVKKTRVYEFAKGHKPFFRLLGSQKRFFRLLFYAFFYIVQLDKRNW